LPLHVGAAASRLEGHAVGLWSLLAGVWVDVDRGRGAARVLALSPSRRFAIAQSPFLHCSPEMPLASRLIGNKR
jgi:hypothetical protein